MKIAESGGTQAHMMQSGGCSHALCGQSLYKLVNKASLCSSQPVAIRDLASNLPCSHDMDGNLVKGRLHGHAATRRERLLLPAHTPGMAS